MEDIFGKPTVVSNEALKVFFTDNFTHGIMQCYSTNTCIPKW